MALAALSACTGGYGKAGLGRDSISVDSLAVDSAVAVGDSVAASTEFLTVPEITGVYTRMARGTMEHRITVFPRGDDPVIAAALGHLYNKEAARAEVYDISDADLTFFRRVTTLFNKRGRIIDQRVEHSKFTSSEGSDTIFYEKSISISSIVADSLLRANSFEYGMGIGNSYTRVDSIVTTDGRRYAFRYSDEDYSGRPDAKFLLDANGLIASGELFVYNARGLLIQHHVVQPLQERMPFAQAALMEWKDVSCTTYDYNFDGNMTRSVFTRGGSSVVTRCAAERKAGGGLDSVRSVVRFRGGTPSDSTRVVSAYNAEGQLLQAVETDAHGNVTNEVRFQPWNATAAHGWVREVGEGANKQIICVQDLAEGASKVFRRRGSSWDTYCTTNIRSVSK